VEELLDLRKARVDPDDLRCALGEQVVAKPTAAIHLDEKAADLAQGSLARLQERTALAPKQSGVGAPRGDAACIGPAPAKKWRHPGEFNEAVLRPRS
jgi:hypothetical protein